MNSPRSISVIVTTYNRSEHLRRCLVSLERQTRQPDEIVIADDGSDESHMRVIEQIISRSPLKIVYARQEHRGFRVSASRNNGVRSAKGEYLFFTDGDLVLFPEVLEIHSRLAERRRWLTGFAVWLTEQETRQVTEGTIRSQGLEALWRQVKGSRTQKLVMLARRFRRQSFLSRVWPSERRLRRVHLAGGHCSMYREAYEEVNGFDENYRSWGREDEDFGLRLLLAGYRGRTVADRCRMVHLFHPTARRPDAQATGSSFNNQYFKRPRQGVFQCENGLINSMNVDRAMKSQ